MLNQATLEKLHALKLTVWPQPTKSNSKNPRSAA